MKSSRIKEGGTKKPFKIEGSLFVKSLKLLKSNPSSAGLMILFDALFLSTFFATFRIFAYFAENLGLPQVPSSIFAVLVLSIIYYLLIILAYSFFKCGIFDFMKSLFEKSEISFRRLGKFYLLNIVIAGIFFFFFLLLNFLLASIKEAYRPIVFPAFAAPISVLMYILTNTTQSLFYEGHSINDALRKGLRLTFTKIKLYSTVLAVMLTASILWLAVSAFGYLLNFIGYRSYAIYQAIYRFYGNKSIILAVFTILFYFVFFMNRITFYRMVKEANAYLKK